MCLSRIGSGHARFDPGVDLVGDVLDAHQLIELKVWAFGFFGAGLGVKAGFDVVVARGGELLHAACADVMIRERQSVGGNEGAGTPIVKADGGKPEVIEPLLRELEAVLGLDLIFRRLVVEPHALIG